MTIVDQFTDQVFRARTGLDKYTFLFIFAKYCGLGTPVRRQAQLFALFVYFKVYPVWRCKLTSCPQQLRRHAAYLASVIDELEYVWNNRHDVSNRQPHYFAPSVAGCLDSFPIRVARPRNNRWQRLMYNGKFKFHVVKIQAICNHAGAIIWYSGPHLGTVMNMPTALSMT
jgi:hypothetical protein